MLPQGDARVLCRITKSESSPKTLKPRAWLRHTPYITAEAV
ncbi:hypothetical protein [Neisseria bacilliformis]|nr:hypothetical protein [Neisseria bacilliformis]